MGFSLVAGFYQYNSERRMCAGVIEKRLLVESGVSLLFVSINTIKNKVLNYSP